MSNLIQTSFYNDEKDELIVKTSFDNSAVLESNLRDRNSFPETGGYKGNFVKVASIDEGDIIRLKNEGFNILSPDPDEVKRALLHIQTNERHLLTVTGTPIAKKKTTWV